MNEHEKFAEELVEHGLARAGEVEPLAGLEQRLLGKLETTRARRLRWWWMAAPVAAALLLVALLYWRPAPAKPAPQIVEAPRQAPPVAPAPPPAPAVAQTPRPPRMVARASRPPAAVEAPAPREEVFPSPAPLSEEEKVLVAFARRQPDAAGEAAQQQKRPAEKVAIAAIKIEPLPIAQEDSNGIQ